jgi:hypothetical protein
MIDAADASQRVLDGSGDLVLELGRRGSILRDRDRDRWERHIRELLDGQRAVAEQASDGHQYEHTATGMGFWMAHREMRSWPVGRPVHHLLLAAA